MVTMNFGKWSLENDVDFKVIPDGFEIFSSAVEKYGINPSDIQTVEDRPARADWGTSGSIMVAETIKSLPCNTCNETRFFDTEYVICDRHGIITLETAQTCTGA